MKRFCRKRGGGPVTYFLADSSRLYQAGLPQQPQMMGYSGTGHPCKGGDRRDAFLTMAKDPEDPCPASIPKQPEKLCDFPESLFFRPFCSIYIHAVMIARGKGLAYTGRKAPFLLYSLRMGFGLRDIARTIRQKIDSFGNKGKGDERSVEEGTKAVRLSDQALLLLSQLFSELGPRPAASASSRHAARRIGTEMEKSERDVIFTTSRVYPRARKGMLLFSYLFLIISAMLTLVGLPYLSLLVIGAYVFAFYQEMFGDGGWLRCFMRTDEAANVHVSIEPEEDVRSTIVFSAHHDSARIRREAEGRVGRFASLPFLQPACLALAAVASFISAIVEISGGIFWRFNFPPVPVILLLLVSLGISALSFSYINSVEEEYSPGAGDDLSGVSVVVTLLSHFSRERKEGRRMRNTRLIFVSFDGEECGRCGSRSWYHDNGYLIENGYNLNFDGLYGEDDLAFLSSDGNGLVSLSGSLASRCSSIASAMGYRIPVGRMGPLGGETDAASAASASLEATTLTSMASGSRTPAHSEEDTPDKVSEEALSRAIAIAIRLAEDIDGRKQDKQEDAAILLSERKYKLSRY